MDHSGTVAADLLVGEAVVRVLGNPAAVEVLFVDDSNGIFPAAEVPEALALARTVGDYPGVRLRGVMGMATFTDDTDRIRREFRTLKSLSGQLAFLPDCDQVSMGMSEDWRIAVEEGTTLVRIGTSIFGKRATK